MPDRSQSREVARLTALKRLSQMEHRVRVGVILQVPYMHVYMYSKL